MRIKNSKTRLKKAASNVKKAVGRASQRTKSVVGTARCAVRSSQRDDPTCDSRGRSPHQISKVSSIGKSAQVLRYDLQARHDALIETQAALEVSNARYAELYDVAPVGYIT